MDATEFFLLTGNMYLVGWMVVTDSTLALPIFAILNIGMSIFLQNARDRKSIITPKSPQKRHNG